MTAIPTQEPFDYILVGGGLQSGLAVLAILHRQPWASLLILEKNPMMGGNHTWCFHGSDIPASARSWFEPLKAHEWANYDIHYPGFDRTIELSYGCVPSHHFRDVVTARLDSSDRCHVEYDATVKSVEAHQVCLEDGRVFHGQCVVDARGVTPQRQPTEGYQKFVGLEVELEEAHGLERPILMDGRVPQTDGLRFVYILPLGPRRLLVEDTYFSDHPQLDEVSIADEVQAYIRQSGWRVLSECRRESGVLPLPWYQPSLEVNAGPFMGGYRGGYFHPVTGYSLPLAIRFAEAVSHPESMGDRRLRLTALNTHITGQRRNLHRLNRVLFEYYEPEHRWHLMARFYRRPESTIGRFYSMELTGWDIARIIVGPIPKKMRWTARRGHQEDNL